MRKWKSWQFGRTAKSWPVAECAASWFRAHGGTALEDATALRRMPSCALPDSLQKIIGSPSDYLVQKRKSWDILKYARLYTGEAYPLPASYRFVVRDAWLHVPSGFVITDDKRVLAFSSYSLPSLYEGHSSTDLGDAPLVEEPAFKLCTVWGQNYAHWLVDGLPKADVLEANDNLLIVADKPSPDFQGESLSLLGLCNVQKPETELIRFRELHFVSTGRSGVPDPRPLLRIRERLRTAAGTTGTSRRLYISRQNTRRRIVNEDSVERVLSDFGFEKIFPEKLGFADQVRLFAGAEAIFGAHGAGTMNVLFAPSGAALIEAFNPKVWDHAAHRVASLCGVRHYHVFGDNASPGFDISIDPQLLAKTLALALCKTADLPPSLVEHIY